MILLVGLSNLVSSESSQVQTGNIAQSRMTGEKIAEIINTVYINGIGYTISVTIPSTMTVYTNNPAGFISVYSSNTGTNISIKVIPKNIQTSILNGGNMYNVTHNASDTITFSQL